LTSRPAADCAPETLGPIVVEAEAAHDGLSGNQPLEAALADYEVRRNEALARCSDATRRGSILILRPPLHFVPGGSSIACMTS
jgi:hypothetical protein